MAELLLEQKGTMRTPAGGVTGVHHVQMSVCVRALQGRMGQSECDKLTHRDFAEIQGPAPNTGRKVQGPASLHTPFLAGPII